MSQIDELERKVDALQEKNKRLMKLNTQLRTLVYGPDYEEEIHIKAHNVINSFFALEIDTPIRLMNYVKAREYYYAFLRKNTKMSFKQIINTLSITPHHSTIIHAIEKFYGHFETEKQYRKDYETIEALILTNYKSLDKAI